ncbi:ABC transporter permease [Paeniglutamicibacter terrestris]|uniref:ABC transporter permease n=1 Tax=Paeniglutamicibacter terrestris TaxID=2723403 RepID=A0ABX1G4S7_9MICC|nr:ABC transporter permease [Paeniglutamicibacter terrestris]ASN40627.1 ABC transporter permease [Arthrobacter sp. 7749]NKG21019.1 ABC transporter permease [Paeniglutamicibacter terrestris]
MSTAILEIPGDTGAPTPTRKRPSLLAWAGYGVVVLVLGIFALGSPYFLQWENLSSVLNQAAVFGIAGIGLAVVIITGGDDVLEGGIDLSVGATAGLAGSVTAVAAAAGAGSLRAVLTGLAVAAALGALNGAAVILGLRPLLATLATMGIATSLDLVVSDNIKVALDGGVFLWLRQGSIAGLPASVLVLAVAALVSWWAVARTSWGVHSYAVGQNSIAASIAGLSVARHRFMSYVISGVLGGIAGVLLASRLSAAVPGIGGQILLDIILVAYMSTVFSRRLVVNIPGTVVAAIFVAGLANGLTLLGVASQWVGAAKGVLILLVLAVVVVRGRNTAK